MAIKQLQSVNFFISLPSPIDIQAGASIPRIEIDDGSESAAIRFIDEDGISKRCTMRFVFHQVAWNADLPDVGLSLICHQSNDPGALHGVQNQQYQQYTTKYA